MSFLFFVAARRAPVSPVFQRISSRLFASKSQNFQPCETPRILHRKTSLLQSFRNFLLPPRSCRYSSTTSTTINPNSDHQEGDSSHCVKEAAVDSEGKTWEDISEIQRNFIMCLYTFSRSMYLLAFTQFTCAAWIYMSSIKSKDNILCEVSFQTIFAVVFPFVFAILLRRLLNSISCSMSLNTQGGIPIENLTLQITRRVTFMMERAITLSVVCTIGICVGMLWNVVNMDSTLDDAKLETR